MLALASLAVGLPALAGRAAPRLVLFLVVDQLRPEALDAGLPGGIGRLVREGRRFPEAALEHAHTETCPGHAALATGRHPGPAGIPGNAFFAADPARVVYCVEDASEAARTLGGSSGRSPRVLRVPALGDWLKAASPRSRVFALAGKDRAAIVLGGWRPDGVYWLDAQEALGFTTSQYYGAALPAWLQRWTGEDPLGWGFLSRVPRRWEHAAKPGPRADDHPAEATRFGRTSGRPLRGADRPTTLARVTFSPFLDEITLDLARALVREEGLGSGPQVDLLALGLSATDFVGHLYGPYSHEARDALQHLDTALGAFLSFLDDAVGRGRWLAVLASDHGVAPLPEWWSEIGRSRCPVPGGRVDATALRSELVATVQERLAPGGQGAAEWLLVAGSRLAVNRERTARDGVRAEDVVREARLALERQPGVARVWSAEEMASGRGPAPFAALYAHSFDPERSGDLAVQPRRDCVLTPYPRGTTHGSPYRYDRAIPLVFAGPGVAPGVRTGHASAVDVVPTLLDLLGLTVPAGLDGRVLPLGAPRRPGRPAASRR